LIAAGKSNAQIAQALVVAISTLKAHVNHLFGKLAVSSRTQAIARAHELHLLYSGEQKGCAFNTFALCSNPSR
jgi:LuxR family maltose regulon positive regulatory protein